MSATPERPDRRTFLRFGAGIGAAGVLSACTLNNPLNSTKTPAVDAVRDLAPDVAIAVEAVALLQRADADRVAAGTTHPVLATPLAGLGKVYQAHLDALTAAVPAGVDTSPSREPWRVPKSARAAQEVLVEDVRGLHQKLVGFAVRAESGPFARLLGSMSAALSQQAVVLARSVPR